MAKEHTEHTEGVTKKRSKEDTKALPGCMKESVNYIIECVTCRKNGVRRVYLGETSRSCYQRGLEHTREIDEGIITHPIVLHFWEEHNGEKQNVLMRILSGHLTPMDRQIQESVNILGASRNPPEALNLQSEWGGSKIPGLNVHTPKGVSSARIDGSQHGDFGVPGNEAAEKLEEAQKRGSKRLQYLNDKSQDSEKECGGIRKKMKFGNTGKRKKEDMVMEEGLGGISRTVTESPPQKTSPWKPNLSPKSFSEVMWRSKPPSWRNDHDRGRVSTMPRNHQEQGDTWDQGGAGQDQGGDMKYQGGAENYQGDTVKDKNGEVKGQRNIKEDSETLDTPHKDPGEDHHDQEVAFLDQGGAKNDQDDPKYEYERTPVKVRVSRMERKLRLKEGGSIRKKIAKKKEEVTETPIKTKQKKMEDFFRKSLREKTSSQESDLLKHCKGATSSSLLGVCGSQVCSDQTSRSRKSLDLEGREGSGREKDRIRTKCSLEKWLKSAKSEEGPTEVRGNTHEGKSRDQEPRYVHDKGKRK